MISTKPLSSSLSADTPLINQGLPRLGQFNDSLQQLNIPDFKLHNPFGQQANRLSQWLGFKQFQYFGGMSQRFIFGCALAHLRHTGVAFIYVYDQVSKKLFSHSIRSPLGIGLTLSDNPVEGESHFKWRNTSIHMGYHKDPRKKTVRIKIGKHFSLDAEMPETDFEPMSLCTRTAYSGWVYANKTAGLNIQGSLHFQGETFNLESLGAMGHHDFSCGFMRRETYWNWACLSALVEGHRIGLNLSCGVNETSYTENCLWIDGKLLKVNLTRFAFQQNDLMQPWHIWSDDGQVDLYFNAAGMHHEHLNAGIIASNFRQLFGHFEGSLHLPTKTLTLHNIPGFVEDQYVKW